MDSVGFVMDSVVFVMDSVVLAGDLKFPAFTGTFQRRRQNLSDLQVPSGCG